MDAPSSSTGASSEPPKAQHKKKVIFSDVYDLREDLGKGAFSMVKKCVHKETRLEYAAKIINKQRLSARDMAKLEKEERICRRLKHPNIVQLHDSISEDRHHYLVFDLVTGGELFDEIVAREYYSENDASSCMQQVLESVHYCHENHVLHRDLKPENLLLASKRKGSAVKLADFGLAVELESNEPLWHGFAGTPGYLSPEVLKREPYYKKVDVWACGVILYILLVGYPPFWDEDQRKLYAQIKMGRFEFPSPEWDTVTKEAKTLIRNMLKTDPNARFTAHQALNSPWISQRQRFAPTFHRQETIAGLKKFNARRKLKGAILTTMLATRSSLNLFRSRVSESDLRDPPVHSSKEHAVISEEGGTEEGPLAVSSDISLSHRLSPTEGTGPEDTILQVIKATKRLLDCIRLRDFSAYKKMCDPNLLTFTKNGGSHLLEGLNFDQFTLSNLPASEAENVIMVHPRVQLLGTTAAVICYVRLNQTIDKSGVESTTESKETRVWEKRGEQWICTHVHTS